MATLEVVAKREQKTNESKQEKSKLFWTLPKLFGTLEDCVPIREFMKLCSCFTNFATEIWWLLCS
jgi:hypothetical protein